MGEALQRRDRRKMKAQRASITHFLFLALCGWSGGAIYASTQPCTLRQTRYGSVCVCTATYCDYLDNPQPSGVNNLSIVSSSKEGLRFSITSGQFGDKLVVQDAFASIQLFGGFGNLAQSIILPAVDAVKSSDALPVKIFVNRSERYQNITGFGGGFTGAVSYILTELDPALQDHVYRSYFHETGIGYNMLRMSIGGSDFDLYPWAYNESPRNDRLLKNFTALHPLDEQKVQQLHRLMNVSQLEQLKIMAAAWSPPKWMKTNNEWTGFGILKPEYYQTWATYHKRFIELMHAKNMPIWAISTGNEPLNGIIGWYFVRFMSLGWTPQEQAIWLSEFLGPTIKYSQHSDVLIFGNDDQRYTFPAWFRAMNSTRPDALDYLSGLAVHWYWDAVFPPKLLDATHSKMPDKLLINTESCIGDKPWETHGPLLGYWDRAEQYIRAYMQDLQHAVNGWIDWNMVLDEQGGPNYVKNFVDAAIIVNTTSRREFYKQPLFYAIGHFSKFLPEGSVRVAVQVSDRTVDAVAFSRPDGTLALVLFNSNDVPLNVTLTDSVRGDVEVVLPQRSVHTVVYN